MVHFLWKREIFRFGFHFEMPSHGAQFFSYLRPDLFGVDPVLCEAVEIHPCFSGGDGGDLLDHGFPGKVGQDHDGLLFRSNVPGSTCGLSAGFPGQQVDELVNSLHRYDNLVGPAIQAGALNGDPWNRDSREEFAFQDLSDLDGAVRQ